MAAVDIFAIVEDFGGGVAAGLPMILGRVEFLEWDLEERFLFHTRPFLAGTPPINGSHEGES